MGDKKEFIEIQTIRHWWIWVILLIASLPLIIILIYQLASNNLVGNHPASNLVLLLVLAFIFLPLFLVFYLLKLTVKINQEGIYYGFTKYPNELKWGNVKEISIIKYSYFGFGYKISSEYGEIYNTTGDMGLWITTAQGGKILLGTNQPDKLKSFLEGIGKM